VGRTLQLTDREQAMLDGAEGPAVAMAMRIVVGLARALDAERLLEIEGAHIDSCLYHGPAGLEFAERLVSLGGTVRVPTTLNVSSLDRMHPELVHLDGATHRAADALMRAYETLGASPTWTCAPYQLQSRPSFGQHVAWAESNAIVFANSVLGARTDRYGDFADIAAAIAGRAPAAGFHLDRNRYGTVVYDLSALPSAILNHELLCPVLGHLIGGDVGDGVPIVVGLDPAVPDDDLKALGAAAASSGGVGMFHVVGRTPEAPDLDTALGGLRPQRVETLTGSRLSDARNGLTRAATDKPLGVVNLGTPHFSSTQLQDLVHRLDRRPVHPQVTLYVNTGRDALAASGTAETLADLGVRVVTDTCTYITAIIDNTDTTGAMTNSAKWAYYAPGNIGADVVFASLDECVESAVAGTYRLQGRTW
jgi:predicted aconitase